MSCHEKTSFFNNITPSFQNLLAAMVNNFSNNLNMTIQVSICLVRILMHIMRPTAILGNILGTSMYRSIEQYQDATKVPGILILRIDSPIYFANANYLKDRFAQHSFFLSVFQQYFYSNENSDVNRTKKRRTQYVIFINDEYKIYRFNRSQLRSFICQEKC